MARPGTGRPSAPQRSGRTLLPPYDLGLALLALAALVYWLSRDVTPAPLSVAEEARSTQGPVPVTVRCPLAGAVVPSGIRPVPNYWFSGATGYEDALRQQEAQATPMVVYFFTEWCGYCRQIDRDLFASRDVLSYFNRAVLRVRVNPESGEAERRLAESFEVTGFPSFFVLVPDGEAPHRTSLYQEGEGHKPASLPELQERIESHALRYAQRLTRDGYERRAGGDPEGALTLLDRALQVAPREADGWMQRAVVREQQGALDLALADYAMVAVLRPGGRAHERAVRALQKARRFDEAVACATDWMRREPKEIEPLRQRGRSHWERGDLTRAREDAARACNLGDERACRSGGRS